MALADEGGKPDAGGRWGLEFAFSVDGDLRFLSHNDMLRMFRRALARAELPVRFTEGFNPRPRMTIPLPRPVGIASQAELLIVELAEFLDPSEAKDRLARQMPAGVDLTGARAVDARHRPRPVEARYRLMLDAEVTAELQVLIRRILESNVVETERVNPKTGRTRRLDVKPALAELRIEGRDIQFALRTCPEGTPKPAEIGALLGFDPGSINSRIQRMEVRWQ